MKKQSIIIPFHKDKNMLLYSLKTLHETLPLNENIEIIIVGNNRNRKELDFELPYAQDTFLKTYDNIFYPNAVNLGVSKSTGDIITICDPDVFYLPGWYEALLNKMCSEDVGAVSSKLINPRTGRILDFGVYYSKYNAIHSLTGILTTHTLAGQDRMVQSACSAVLMTSRKLFDMVGGMDPDLPYAYTDFDYCLKLQEAGYKIWVSADSEVYHKGSTDPDNSKYYAFNYLRTDCKGMFYAKDYQKFKQDFAEWFQYTYSYFKTQHPEYPQKYVLLDFTTLYNRQEFYDVFTNNLKLEFLDKEVLTIKERNAKEISLHQVVKFNLIDCNSPILYFVDTFTCLFQNALWFRMRDISRDLVIDRNGNILPLSDIAENRC